MSDRKNSSNTINKKINKNDVIIGQNTDTQSRENAFDKLLKLQLLLQKHSGLKELCMH